MYLLQNKALVAFDVEGHLVGVALLVEVSVPLREVKFHWRRCFVGFRALTVTKGVGVEVVYTQIKDWGSMVCKAPASVGESGCEYRADAALWSDQDMVNVTDTLEFPGECALGFPTSCCRRGGPGGS